MSLENGILILLVVGIGFYFWRRSQHSGKNPLRSSRKEDFREFWTVLEASIATYKSKMLPYVINDQIVAGKYPQSILPLLEQKYGKAGGTPWLSIPQEWKGRSAYGIRAWMEVNKMPFDENLPALHQLEILLEKEVQAEAKTLMEAAANE